MGSKFKGIPSRACSARTSVLTDPTKSGVTLLELLVSIGIISLLLAMLLPAVQMVRESARRMQCQSQIRQLGLAVHAYHASFKVFPSGSFQSYPEAKGVGFSMFVALLPQLEQTSLWQRIDFSDSYEANREILATRIGILLCPSDSGGGSSREIQPTNFVGNSGSGIQYEGKFNGFFQPAKPISTWGGGMLKATDFTDGLSNTAMVSEVLIGNGSPEPLRNVWEVNPEMSLRNQMDEFADACEQLKTTEILGDAWTRGGSWMWGDTGETLYNHVQTPGKKSCTNAGSVLTGAYPPVSHHSGGVNMCLGDGSARFVSGSVNRNVWRAVGSRSHGDIVPSF